MKRSKNELVITQERYAADLLQRSGMSNCKAIDTPLCSTEKLSAVDGDVLGSEDSVKYRSIVGALQYLTLTRPDISFAVKKVCQFLHTPTTVHYSAVKRIIRYVQGTMNLGLRFGVSRSMIVSAFSDVNWWVCCLLWRQLDFMEYEETTHGIKI